MGKQSEFDNIYLNLEELEKDLKHLKSVVETIKDEFREELSTLEEMKGVPTTAARIAALYNHFDIGLEQNPRNPMFSVRKTDEPDKK